jgi:hypothetical protein
MPFEVVECLSQNVLLFPDVFLRGKGLRVADPFIGVAA